ncbi:MAG: hypothetical protein ABI625_00900 [bacterium]
MITSAYSLVVMIFAVMERSSALMPFGATATMVVTITLQVAFLAIQAFPNGRAPIAIRGMGPDAWNTVVVMTAIPGAAWHQLAAVAAPPMQLIMPGYVTPLFNAVLFMFVRELQKRRDGRARA